MGDEITMESVSETHPGNTICHIHKLAPEIISMICEFLCDGFKEPGEFYSSEELSTYLAQNNKTDIAALRLTCREFAEVGAKRLVVTVR